MADDDADQTCNAQESHEAKWRVHDCRCDQGTDGAIRRCGKDESGLTALLNWMRSAR